jgi:nucleotide-binding universal stress UspA family protein
MGRIVVGVDGSDGAVRALRWAVEEAVLRDAEVQLVLGYVLHVHRPPFTSTDRELAERAMQEIVERNADVLRRVTWKTTAAPLLGRPYADAVLEAGDDADLVVVGSRGLGGFKELVLGSTSYRVAAHATAPVAVVRGGEDGDKQPCIGIVVGVDGSRAAIRALRWAVAEAVLRGVDVTVMHGYFAPSAALLSGVASPEQIETERTRARSQAEAVVDAVLADVDVPEGVTVTPQVVAGTPAAAILGHATAEHLTVVGTRGYGGIRRAVVGSTSHQVLHHAPGPVVVVP